MLKIPSNLSTGKILFGICTVLLTGFGCTKDKCKDVNCLNGGKCAEGTCVCANGFSGDRCQTPPRPPEAKTVKITGIQVTGFPQTKSDGDGWDNSFTGTPPPEIFVKVYVSGTLVSNTTDNRYENVRTSDLPIGWNYTSPIEISNPASSLSIEMWDYDSLQDDEFMGSARVSLGQYLTTQPSSITVSNGSISYRVSLIWTN